MQLVNEIRRTLSYDRSHRVPCIILVSYSLKKTNTRFLSMVLWAGCIEAKRLAVQLKRSFKWRYSTSWGKAVLTGWHSRHIKEMKEQLCSLQAALCVVFLWFEQVTDAYKTIQFINLDYFWLDVKNCVHLSIGTTLTWKWAKCLEVISK